MKTKLKGGIKMKLIEKELRKEIKEINESSTDFELPVQAIEGWEGLKDKILNENNEWIVEKAYENCGGSFNGVIYLNIDTGELIARTLSNNTYIKENNWVKIYELSANWLSNAIITVNDILDGEEWEVLQNEFGEEQVNYLDEKQLEEIGIDLDERLKEYLGWEILN